MDQLMVKVGDAELECFSHGGGVAIVMLPGGSLTSSTYPTWSRPWPEQGSGRSGSTLAVPHQHRPDGRSHLA